MKRMNTDVAATRKTLLAALADLNKPRREAENENLKKTADELRRKQFEAAEARRAHTDAIREYRVRNMNAEFNRDDIEAQLRALMPPHWSIAIRALRRADSLICNRAGTTGGLARDIEFVTMIRDEVRTLERLPFEDRDPVSFLEESVRRMSDAVRPFAEVYAEMSRDVLPRSARAIEMW